jgi:hypothetical protein
VATLFERLSAERPPQIEEAVKPPRRHNDRIIFLLDVLVSGPVPVTCIREWAAARGFTKKQLRSAKEQIDIIAFKETGSMTGRWLWALPHHAQYTGT